MWSHRQFANFAICDRPRGEKIAICVASIEIPEMSVPLQPDYLNM